MALAEFEPDDPDLAIPHGALQNGIREAPERHFPANRNGLITHTPVEPLGPKPAKTLDLQRKWKLALLASLIFHAAVALFFMLTIDEAVLMEGAEFSGIAFLGEGADQVKAGDIQETEEPAVDVTMVTMLEARPVKTVEAETVPVEETVEATEIAKAVTTDVETLEPVKETPVEQVSEAKAEPVQPPERAEPLKAEPETAPPTERAEPDVTESRPAPAVSETVPEVLATDRVELVEDDNVVQKPAETQAAEPVEAVEAAQPERCPDIRGDQGRADGKPEGRGRGNGKAGGKRGFKGGTCRHPRDSGNRQGRAVGNEACRTRRDREARSQAGREEGG